MNRRNLLKTVAAASTLPISGFALAVGKGKKAAPAAGPVVVDIRRAHAEGKYSNVFCWQSATHLDDGVINNPLGGSSRTALRGFHEIGLRIVSLCYNVSNSFGGGNLEPQIGLTRAGRRLVEEIHKLNIVLDIGGHTGEQTSLDAIAMAPEMPVICTHTNVAALADNARCISDRVIDAIARTGGVIGITAVSDFHIRSKGNEGQVRLATLDDHVDQYDYIKKRVGVEHVAMGTDFVEGMSIPYTSVNTDIMPNDMLARPWRFVENFESIEKFPNLRQAFQRRGWTEQEINLAMGENWLRIYQRIWGA